MPRKHRTLTLDQAASEWRSYLQKQDSPALWDRGYDYYALSSEEAAHLRYLFSCTKWKQGPSSRAMGRSGLYAFSIALRKRIERRFPSAAGRDARRRRPARSRPTARRRTTRRRRRTTKGSRRR